MCSTLEQNFENECGLDILSIKDPMKKSDMFRVSFAFYSASPHIFLLPAEAVVSNKVRRSTLEDLDTYETLEFLRVARDTLEVFGVSDENVLLSVHVGSWKHFDYFHARLCFGQLGDHGKEIYLRIFDEMKITSPMCNLWPSKATERFIKKAWHVQESESPSSANIEEMHHRRVRQFRGGEQVHHYKNEDLEALRDILEEPYTPLSKVAYEKLKFHHSQPLIGLPYGYEIGDPEGMMAYLRELQEFFRVIKSEIKECEGGHLCIKMNSQGLRGSNSPVLGYLHIAPVAFYRILRSPRKRDAWVQNFEQWSGDVYT